MPRPWSRRDFVRRLAAAASVASAPRLDAGLFGAPYASAPDVARPRPSAAQLAWQRDEHALFLHFGVNTFTDREWGDGTENPAIFNPAALDARQWARVARESGFRSLVLTAKHHDGFCLWPTRTTSHSVAASPFRGGSGDVMREFADACRAEGLRAGVYCSPWDRNSAVYGTGERYNDYFCDQLTELLTNYGALAEVWFDGANGEGPGGRRQEYDWPRFWGVVRRLQPAAVIFSDAGPDVRWIGNERGVAGETNWSTIDPDAVPYPGADGPGIIQALQEGDPSGSAWRPGETDVSIRPGWFHHAAEDARVKSVADLVELHLTSVGRNSKLLLNVPPTPAGVLHDVDVARLRGMHEALAAQRAAPVVPRNAWSFRATAPRRAVLSASFARPVDVALVDLREPIEQGQRVARFVLEGRDGGAWRALAEGTTIGYCRLARLAPVRARQVRLTVESVEEPLPLSIQLFSPSA